MKVVRHDVHVGVAVVYRGLENGYLLVGELGPLETADEFLGLAGKHGAANDLHAAGFYCIF